jgi:hypothetical protein
MEGFLKMEDESAFSRLAEMLPLSTTEVSATTIPEYLARSRQRSPDLGTSPGKG